MDKKKESNDYIYEWIKEVCKQIPLFFINEESIKKHLDAFITWDDYEWFNIALILYQRPDATIVNSKSNWEDLIKKDFFVKKGEKGIRVIIPTLDKKKIKWKSQIIWDISQCQDCLEFGTVSKLRIVVEEIFSQDIYESLNEKTELIDYLVNKSMAYIHKTLSHKSEVVNWIHNCIIYILSHYLPINANVNLILDCELSEKEYIYLYCGLKNVAGYLNVHLINYYAEKSSKEKEIAEIEYARKIWNMTIHERIESAKLLILKKNKVVSTVDDQENFDFDEPTGEERRVIQ